MQDLQEVLLESWDKFHLEMLVFLVHFQLQRHRHRQVWTRDGYKNAILS